MPDDVAGTEKVDVRLLPTLKMDAKDPAANELLRMAAVTDPDKRVVAMTKGSSASSTKRSVGG